MERCSRCILPETYATIEFDSEGVCNLCRQHEIKDDIDWGESEKKLKNLLEKYKKIAKERGSRYDCIVPYSGGKDSSYTLYVLKEKYEMNPLAVTINHMFLTDTGKRNNEKVVRKLGVDHIMFSPSWSVVKKFCLASLKKTGDFCYHCHTGVYSGPLRIAVKWKVPLVIWGEPNAEQTQYYTYDDEEKLDENHFKNVFGYTAEDFIGMEGLTRKDLKPFMFPNIKELKDLELCSICLGTYIPWDYKKQVELIKEKLGWEGREVEGSFVDYDKVECKYIGVRDYLKFIKRGFGRSAQIASMFIRDGDLSRIKALEIAEKFDGKRPHSLDNFLRDLRISEEEFMEIAKKHRVSPWKNEKEY